MSEATVGLRWFCGVLNQPDPAAHLREQAAGVAAIAEAAFEASVGRRLEECIKQDVRLLQALVEEAASR